MQAAQERHVVATAELQRLERLVEVHEALAELAAIDAKQPQAGEDEAPAADRISRFRGLVAELPIAVEAQRRAAQHRVQAEGEHAQALQSRERLGLAAQCVGREAA